VYFTGNGKTGFNTTYQRVTMSMKPDDIVDQSQIEFARNQPKNPKDVYAYCLEQVRRRP
jgi:hypothetical protein